MYLSAPRLHDLAVKLKVKDGNGVDHFLGPVIPGFEEYRENQITSILMQVLHQSPDLLHSYFSQVCTELEAKDLKRPLTLTLIVDVSGTTEFSVIRSGGPTSEKSTITQGPFPCPH